MLNLLSCRVTLSNAGIAFLCFMITSLFSAPVMGQGMVVTGPNVKQKFTISPTLMATGPNGSWAIVQGGLNTKQSVTHHNAPETMVAAMKAFAGSRTITAIAITPDGGWVVAADQLVSMDKVPTSFRATVLAMQKSNQKIHGIAFNPYFWEYKKGYVILAGEKFAASGVSPELNKALQVKGDKYAIAFNQTGGWALLTSNGLTSKHLPVLSEAKSFDQQYKALRKQGKKPLAIAFPTTSFRNKAPWVMMGSDFYAAAQVDESLKNRLQRSVNLKGEILNPKTIKMNRPIIHRPKIQFRLTDLMMNPKHLSENLLKDKTTKWQGSDPMILLYTFQGRLDGKGQFLISDTKNGPLVFGLKSGQTPKTANLNTNWATKKNSRIKIPEKMATYTTTLEPYQFFGVVAVVLEYGSDASYQDIIKWQDLGFRAVQEKFQFAMGEYEKELPYGHFTEEVQSKILRHTIKKLDLFGLAVEHSLNKHLHGMIRSHHTKKHGFGGNSKQPAHQYINQAFVRDIRVMYTVNVPGITDSLRQVRSDHFVPLDENFLTPTRPAELRVGNTAEKFPNPLLRPLLSIDQWKQRDLRGGYPTLLRARVKVLP